MPTLADLRALLERTPDGPARRRAGGTVEGMARMYLPITITRRFTPGSKRIGPMSPLRLRSDGLVLSDPGTAHALLTGLALAKGRDPGPMAMDVGFSRINEANISLNEDDDETSHGWYLHTADGGESWLSTDDGADATVANEPDPVRALALAVAHVLSPSGDRAERVSGGDM